MSAVTEITATPPSVISLFFPPTRASLLLALDAKFLHDWGGRVFVYLR